MFLKAPAGKSVHVALLNGRAIRITDEGREVPQEFLSGAMAQGCIASEGVATPPPEKAKADLAAIKDGIKKMLESNNKADFTSTGLPNRKRLADLIGSPVAAADMEQAMEELEAEAVEAAPVEPAE